MEPQAKVKKYESMMMESQYLEGEVMEEGQEEWLSEGVLTDDDYNPGSQNTEADPNDSNLVSQDESMNSASADDSQGQTESGNVSTTNIEETLNYLEQNNQSSDFPEELNAFLIRKTDGKIIGGDAPKKESDVDESVKQSDDDGNDTDDLLRVLGDGDQSKQSKKKENNKKKSEEHGDSSDDDDDYIFEGKKVKTYGVAETVLNRATATKAVPEDDVTDCSSDEDASTVKQMFTLKKDTPVTPIISTTIKPGNFTITPLQLKSEPPMKTIVKRVVDVPQRPFLPFKQESLTYSKPLQVKRTKAPPYQYVNKTVQGSSNLLKPKTDKDKNMVKLQTDKDKDMVKLQTEKDKDMVKLQTDKGKDMVKLQTEKDKDMVKLQTDKQKDKDKVEEKLDKSKSKKAEAGKENKPADKQGLMVPEGMDEEVPTDCDSDDSDDDEDLYSELPSSDSDMEDWFTLDIRAERAGDYIPLLGDKAYQLLSEERQRVASRLETLKKSLAALSNSGKDIAEQLRQATKTVAELDAMLKVV